MMPKRSVPDRLDEEAARLMLDITRTHPHLGAFVVTGCIGGEGATTLALALAQAAQRLMSGRVLLIDGDLATGGLSRLCGADGRPGLRQIKDRPQPLRDLIVAQPGGFDLLPAGTPGGAQMLDLAGGTLLSDLMAQARGSHALVIWDAEAVGRSVGTKVLLSLVPQVVLVTTSDVTRFDHFTASLNEIANLGATPLALLRNRAGRMPMSVGADQE